MNARDDKLLALVGLLAAGLIAMTVLFSLAWFFDARTPSGTQFATDTCPMSTGDPAHE